MIKPLDNEGMYCAALGRIPQTPDGPHWAAATPQDAHLGERLIRYYWKFARNCAGQEFKYQGGDTLPRSARNRVEEYQEEFSDDGADPDNPGSRPEDKRVPDGIGLYLGDFESDIPRLMHKAAAVFDSSRGRFAPLLARIISNAVKDWTKRRTLPGMSLRAADSPPELSVAETLESVDLGALYLAADAEVMERVRVLTRRRDQIGAAVLRGVWAGHTGADVARKLGMSESGVSQRVASFRAKLPRFDAAMSLHRLAVKFVNNDGVLSEGDLSFLGEVRIRYRGEQGTYPGHLISAVNPSPGVRYVKAATQTISGRTEAMFDAGGDRVRVGDRHLLAVTFHHKTHLINGDALSETESEFDARKAFAKLLEAKLQVARNLGAERELGTAYPTPCKHEDGKCQMMQRWSEDSRPTRRIHNELATWLEARGEDLGGVLAAWKSRESEYDYAGRKILAAPAADRGETVYQFTWGKPHGAWTRAIPVWGSETEEQREEQRYAHLRVGAKACRVQRRWINAADRAQLASQYVKRLRGKKSWHPPWLELVWSTPCVLELVPLAPPLQPFTCPDDGRFVPEGLPMEYHR
jgi:hypothetical protein